MLLPLYSFRSPNIGGRLIEIFYYRVSTVVFATTVYTNIRWCYSTLLNINIYQRMFRELQVSKTFIQLIINRIYTFNN
jgi:hypothetical protein